MADYSLNLNQHIQMPILGLGLYNITEDNEVQRIIAQAVHAGYRLIDTASAYANEDAVGSAIRQCGIPREDLFITTKIWNNAQRMDDVDGAFNRSLERLMTDYIDLYLIHWPVPGCFLRTWDKMAAFQESGKIHAIGVSNFEIRHLKEMESVSSVQPAVNQIEFHPYNYPKELLEYCQEQGIAVQAYAPLARGAYLDDDVMCVLATKYVKSPAQIGLRWIIQKGVAVIPSSKKEEHIISNAQIFDFEIEEEDMAIIDSLNKDLHVAGVPDDLKDVAF